MNNPTIVDQVEQYLSSQRLLLPRLQLWNEGTNGGYRKGPVDFTNIPRSPHRHFRGIMVEGGRTFGRFGENAAMLPLFDPKKHMSPPFDPRDETVLVHCKPLHHPDDRMGCLTDKLGDENRYPDIPDRLDLLLLLRHQFDAIAFTGRTTAAKITRSEKTWPTILKLRDWEQSPSGRHRFNRIKHRMEKLGQKPPEYEVWRRYAATALRHVGLHWPDKPRLRMRKWPDSLSEIGLTVEQSSPEENRYA